MQMWHAFARIGPAVDDDAKAGFQTKFFCNFARGQQQFAEQLAVVRARIGQSRNDALRHNQYMDGRLRINVPKCKDFLIFQHDLGRNLTRDDFLEDGHVSAASSLAPANRSEKVSRG